MQTPKQLILYRLERHVQPLQLLHRVIVIQEQSIVQIEAIPRRVLHQFQQGLVPFGIDGRRLQSELLQHPSHGVSHELRPGRMPIVLGAAHLHHPTTLPGKDIQEFLAPIDPRFIVPNPNPIVHEAKPRPRMPAALGPEHGMCAQDVELGGQKFEQEVAGELLDREDVDEKGAPSEPLEGDGAEDALGGEDGGGEEDDLRVLLAEVVRVAVEGDAEVGGGGGVVGAGVGEDGVALGEEGLGEELAEVAEAEDGDLQGGGLVEVGSELGLVVVRLGGVEGPDAEGQLEAAAEEFWLRKRRQRGGRSERTEERGQVGGGGLKKLCGGKRRHSFCVEREPWQIGRAHV